MDANIGIIATVSTGILLTENTNILRVYVLSLKNVYDTAHLNSVGQANTIPTTALHGRFNHEIAIHFRIFAGNNRANLIDVTIPDSKICNAALRI